MWKIAFKKIYLITCPTNNTLNYLKSLNLTDPSKFKLLYDPIINVQEISKKKREKINLKNFYLSVGRLTRQKNLLFLCKAFKELVKEDNKLKLVIAGNGEEELKIKNFIKKNNLNNNILLPGYVENIYPYFKNSKGFILSSLWEDPGFVLVEASFCRAPVLTSNVWPGPVELIQDDFNGITYENNDIKNFLQKFKYLEKHKDINNLKLNNLKFIKRFTLYYHFKSLSKLF